MAHNGNRLSKSAEASPTAICYKKTGKWEGKVLFPAAGPLSTGIIEGWETWGNALASVCTHTHSLKGALACSTTQ